MCIYHHVFHFIFQYNFKQSYPKDENDSNTVGFFNSSRIYYCPAEDVPTSNISFTINEDLNNPGFPSTSSKLNN